VAPGLELTRLCCLLGRDSSGTRRIFFAAKEENNWKALALIMGGISVYLMGFTFGMCLAKTLDNGRKKKIITPSIKQIPHIRQLFRHNLSESSLIRSGRGSDIIPQPVLKKRGLRATTGPEKLTFLTQSVTPRYNF